MDLFNYFDTNRKTEVKQIRQKQSQHVASVLLVKFWLTMAQVARRTQIPPVLTNICVDNDTELLSMF
jgi:predicted acyltransferase